MTNEKITIRKYIEGCIAFRNESKSWYNLDPYLFYSVKSDGTWYESSDNGDGGYSCAWAFHKSIQEIQRLAPEYLVEELDAEIENLIYQL